MAIKFMTHISHDECRKLGIYLPPLPPELEVKVVEPKELGWKLNFVGHETIGETQVHPGLLERIKDWILPR